MDLISIIYLGGINRLGEKEGPYDKFNIGNLNAQKALILYDPDPFYNLDQQICESIGHVWRIMTLM
jgi:hypothetical protein